MNLHLFRKRYFFLLFIVLCIFSFSAINYYKNHTIQEHLDTKSEQIFLEYQVVYTNFKTVADIIFHTTINDKETLSIFKNREREELFNHLTEKYKKLRDYNLRQLHFHLPNNDSFLRMHRPNKFGDNLTDARSTVRYVNENRKFIHGFEEGRIFNGFRFVYPLFSNQNHIGSVEISFSSLFFIQDMMEHYNVISNFLIDKSVVDEKVFKDEKSNYVQSPISKYYFQRSVLDYIKLDVDDFSLSKALESSVISRINEGKHFSIYSEKTNQVVTFIPLINPVNKNVVAALTVRSDDRFINNLTINVYIVFLIVSFSILVVLVFIFKQYSYQKDLEKEVKNKTKELSTLNLNLKDKVRKEIAKNLEKDKLVQEQSKLASMGEMIGSIAHQWRQPLNALNINIQNLDDDYDDGLIDKRFIDEFIIKNRKVIEFMSQTIDDFRNFFRVDKEKTKFSILEAINGVISLQSAQLASHKIALDVSGDDFYILGLKSEFQQVLLNLINNSKDEMVSRDIMNRNITITLKDKTIYIQDNAGGVDIDILNRVFEPYFTTKEQGSGTGMGLYISKLIIEQSMKAKLLLDNKDDGILVTIDFNEKGSDE